MKAWLHILSVVLLGACSQVPVKLGPLPNTAAVRSGLVETQTNIKRTQSGIARVQDHVTKQESHDVKADSHIATVEEDLDKLLKR